MFSRNNTVSAKEVNNIIRSNKLNETILRSETQHEERIKNIASEIIDKGAKAVFIAGPSSSGKTTAAHRLATSISALSADPVVISLDDYYLNRDDIPTDEYGIKDFENINALDLDRFKSDMLSLVNRGHAGVPIFDFKRGKRSAEERYCRPGRSGMLIVEGIHALNKVVTGGWAKNISSFGIYVCPNIVLETDKGGVSDSSDLRLMRRIARDHESRGTMAEGTLAMWQSVRRGEEKWIIPNIANADAVFDSGLIYEIAVLKKYVYPLIKDISHCSVYRPEAERLIKCLDRFEDAEVENEIPPESILREFIGGSMF